MTDTSGVAGSSETKGPKEAVAIRDWVDVDGNPVDAELATGCKYTDKASGKYFVYQTELPPGKHATMLAIFGALTKAGNIRSTVNTKDPSADIVQAIDDWFQILIDDGTWSADRVGGGLRINAEVLAKAIAAVKNEHHDGAHEKYLSRINSREKLPDPGDKSGQKTILYSTFAMRNKMVEAKYNELLPQHAAAPAIHDL